jgi:hypothetical protein
MKILSIPNSRLIPLGLAMLLAGTNALADAHAHTSKMPPKVSSESVAIVSDSGWANPTLARAAAVSGQALLSHLQSAKAFLVAGSPEGARDALITASEFTNAMERTMPLVAVADDLKTARNKLISGETELFYDDLLPIYASVDDMQLYAPGLAKHVHGKVKKAEAQARSGQSQEAAKTLNEVGEEVTRATVYLPLGLVDNQIQVAMAALKGDHPDQATARVAVDKALKSLVERRFTVVDTPRG